MLTSNSVIQMSQSMFLFLCVTTSSLIVDMDQLFVVFVYICAYLSIAILYDERVLMKDSIGIKMSES